MLGYAIDEQQCDLFGLALTDLSVQAEANAVILMDTGGNILASICKADDGVLSTVAALAAASFSATRELSTLLGESGFNAIHHQGDDSSIFIQNAAGEFLMIVVFDKNTTAGLVRLYVGKTIQELEPELFRVAGQGYQLTDRPNAVFEFDETSDLFGRRVTPNRLPDARAAAG
jgi:predicted regulator of Ras-like GTPase activity (Roadblock/LC7/MglB family)